jgi:hypothetical protein
MGAQKKVALARTATVLSVLYPHTLRIREVRSFLQPKRAALEVKIIGQGQSFLCLISHFACKWESSALFDSGGPCLLPQGIDRGHEDRCTMCGCDSELLFEASSNAVDDNVGY